MTEVLRLGFRREEPSELSRNELHPDYGSFPHTEKLGFRV